MSSFNDSLAYHWPYPLKYTQKQPTSLKKETAFRLGVKFPREFPNSLELDSKLQGYSKTNRPRWLKAKSLSKTTSCCSTSKLVDVTSSFMQTGCACSEPEIDNSKHRYFRRTLGALPSTNEPTITKTPSCVGATKLQFSSSVADTSVRDFHFNLPNLRVLHSQRARKPSSFDKYYSTSTYCPMNPYRKVYTTSVSSSSLLRNLRRQQDIIDQLSSTSISGLEVTPAIRSLVLSSDSPPRSNGSHSLHKLENTMCGIVAPTPPHKLNWHSKSEVLQLPVVGNVTYTTSVVAVATPSNQLIQSAHREPYKYIPPAYRLKRKPPEPAKYADPFKDGGRLYRKRVSDLASMVTDTLIWEKSRQHRKFKQGSNSTLYSN